MYCSTILLHKAYKNSGPPFRNFISNPSVDALLNWDIKIAISLIFYLVLLDAKILADNTNMS